MSDIIDLPATASYVELDWYDDSEVVQVRPRDRQRFELQKDRAIEILQAAKEADRFQKQLELLLNKLAAWANRWEAKISSAIVTLQDGALAFVVVQKSEKYDEDLQDDLSDLDFSIANDVDFGLMKLTTLLLPNVSGEALESFLDRRLLLLVYHHAERDRPHSVSESQP